MVKTIARHSTRQTAHFHSAGDLREIEPCLLDGFFHPESIEYLARDEVLTIPGYHFESEECRYDKIACCLYWRVLPRRKWILSLRNVRSFYVDRDTTSPLQGDSVIGRVGVSGDQTVVIETHERIRIMVEQSKIEGLLTFDSAVDWNNGLRSLSLRL